jgi:hypothetical protein
MRIKRTPRALAHPSVTKPTETIDLRNLYSAAPATIVTPKTRSPPGCSGLFFDCSELLARPRPPAAPARCGDGDTLVPSTVKFTMLGTSL